MDFEPRLSITYKLTSILWSVSNHVPTLTAAKAGINAMSALSVVSSAIFSTVLLRTLHLTSIDLLVLRSASSRCFNPLRVRVQRTLLPPL